jgi:hypothetical protein
MTNVRLSEEEAKWVKKLQRVLNQCPQSLSRRCQSYTIGDSNITLFDEGVYETSPMERDVCMDVSDIGAEICTFDFPFQVWSTAG